MDYLVTILVLLVFLQTRIMDLRRAVYCLSAQSAILMAQVPRKLQRLSACFLL